MSESAEQMLNDRCRAPGPEGAFWRLYETWNPDRVPEWVRSETMVYNHPPAVIVTQYGRLLASASAFFAAQFSDPAAVIDNSFVAGGVVASFNKHLLALRQANKLDRTPGGIIVPALN